MPLCWKAKLLYCVFRSLYLTICFPVFHCITILPSPPFLIEVTPTEEVCHNHGTAELVVGGASGGNSPVKITCD